MTHLSYTIELFEEDGQIVALCPELNVSSFGNGSQSALSSLREAVMLFLEECQWMGTLEAVLEKAVYRRDPNSPGLWRPRQPIQINYQETFVA